MSKTLVAGRPAVRVGPVSVVFRPRSLVVPFLGLIVLVALVIYAVKVGSTTMSYSDVLDVLGGGGRRAHRFIVFDVWLPRVLTGALVGAALAMSGAITQVIARNPLASPDIMGVTGGASVGAVLVIILGGSYGGVSGAVVGLGIPAAALVGALATALFIYVIAWRGGVQSYRLLLVGIGTSVILANVTYWLITLADISDASRAQTWITGSLNDASWQNLRPLAIALVIVIPVTLVGAHVLGALPLGDDSARGLGVRLEWTRGALLLAAVLLAGAATAAAGPVNFVALAAPQIAMRVCRVAQPPLIASLVLGAVLVVAADLIARIPFDPVQLPVGVVTAVLGAPYLIYLLIRRYREAQA